MSVLTYNISVDYSIFFFFNLSYLIDFKFGVLTFDQGRMQSINNDY
jgi:hypothetical protein